MMSMSPSSPPFVIHNVFPKAVLLIFNIALLSLSYLKMMMVALPTVPGKLEKGGKMENVLGQAQS